MISQTLKVAVRDHQMSMRELAQNTGVDENVLQGFLTEEEPALDLATAEKLARHFGMVLPWCFRLEEQSLVSDFSERDETQDEAGAFAIGIEPALTAILKRQLDFAIKSGADVGEIATASGASQVVLDAVLAENGKGVPISVADRLATLFGLRLVLPAV